MRPVPGKVYLGSRCGQVWSWGGAFNRLVSSLATSSYHPTETLNLLIYKRQHAVHEGALPHHLHHQHHGVWGEGLSIGGSWRCAAAKGNKELHQARTLQRNYDAKRRSLLRITVNHHILSTFQWYILVLYCRADLQLCRLTQRHLLLAYMDTTCLWMVRRMNIFKSYEESIIACASKVGKWFV